MFVLGRGVGFGPAETDQRRQGQQAGSADQRDQAEEHPPPAEVAGHFRAEGRSDQTGNDPRGGEDGHHPSPQLIGEAAADGDVGDGGNGAGLEALEGAADNQDRHRRSQSADGEARREEDQAADVGRGRAPAIGLAAGGDVPDQPAQHEGAEYPAVEAEAAEVPRHDGHDRDDSQRLAGHQGDGENETGRQGAPFRSPETVVHIKRLGVA